MRKQNTGNILKLIKIRKYIPKKKKTQVTEYKEFARNYEVAAERLLKEADAVASKAQIEDNNLSLLAE